MTDSEAPRAFYGWRMVGLAFLAYNVGLTMIVNAFGPALPVLQRELHATRAGVSMAFALVMLVIGLLAPIIGNLLTRIRLRTLMMTGSAVNVVGFLLLARAHSLTELLVLFGLLIGPGMSMVAIVAAPTLICRWFEKDRGKALGIGLVQMIGLVTAPLAAILLSAGGRSLLYLCMSGVFAVLIVVMAFVIDWPQHIGQMPRRAVVAEVGTAIPAPGPLSNRAIFSDFCFWLLCMAVGIYTAVGVVFAGHAPSMAIAKGCGPTEAAMLLSACGAGALAGAFIFGWLIDKLGPFQAALLALLFGMAAWAIFAVVSFWWTLMAVAFVLGICTGPLIAIHSACLSELFGQASFSRAMGLSYFVKLPFLIAPAPLAGWLYDRSGNYAWSYAICIASLGVGVTMVALVLFIRRDRTLVAAPPPSSAKAAS